MPVLYLDLQLVFPVCTLFSFPSSDPALHPDRASSILLGPDNSHRVPSKGAPLGQGGSTAHEVYPEQLEYNSSSLDLHKIYKAAMATTAKPQQATEITAMSSGSSTRSGLQAEAWSMEENKRFEVALARYGEGTPDRWARVARAVGGGKSIDQVVRHYERLLSDIQLIESAAEPFYHYPTTHNARRRGAAAADQEQRFASLPSSPTGFVGIQPHLACKQVVPWSWPRSEVARPDAISAVASQRSRGLKDLIGSDTGIKSSWKLAGRPDRLGKYKNAYELWTQLIKIHEEPLELEDQIEIESKLESDPTEKPIELGVALKINVTRGNVRAMTEFDVLGSRSFSLAGVHVDEDDGVVSWWRGPQHRPDPDAQEAAEHDEFMVALFGDDAPAPALAPPPPPGRAPRPAQRTLGDRVAGLELSTMSLRQEVSDLRRDARQDISDLR
uniref:MYB protein n=1 Tax=Zingiber officinale TaxID=94328 RepID=A0AA50CAR5_ZINOF|nr:MYB protein [Zingiber officinale]